MLWRFLFLTFVASFVLADNVPYKTIVDTFLQKYNSNFKSTKSTKPLKTVFTFSDDKMMKPVNDLITSFNEIQLKSNISSWLAAYPENFKTIWFASYLPTILKNQDSIEQKVLSIKTELQKDATISHCITDGLQSLYNDWYPLTIPTGILKHTTGQISVMKSIYDDVQKEFKNKLIKISQGIEPFHDAAIFLLLQIGEIYIDDDSVAYNKLKTFADHYGNDFWSSQRTFWNLLSEIDAIFIKYYVLRDNASKCLMGDQSPL